MIILGIDPGTTSAGYALLDTEPQFRILDAGIVAVKNAHAHERLRELNAGLASLIRKWRPASAAIEKLFFARNVKTATTVSEGKGALLLTAILEGIRVYEYTPLEVKKAVTGDGNATKFQVKKMLHLTIPETRQIRARDDVFDAIAVAYTHHLLERNRHFFRHTNS